MFQLTKCVRIWTRVYLYTYDDEKIILDIQVAEKKKSVKELCVSLIAVANIWNLMS